MGSTSIHLLPVVRAASRPSSAPPAACRSGRQPPVVRSAIRLSPEPPDPPVVKAVCRQSSAGRLNNCAAAFLSKGGLRPLRRDTGRRRVFAPSAGGRGPIGSADTSVPAALTFRGQGSMPARYQAWPAHAPPCARRRHWGDARLSATPNTEGEWAGYGPYPPQVSHAIPLWRRRLLRLGTCARRAHRILMIRRYPLTP